MEKALPRTGAPQARNTVTTLGTGDVDGSGARIVFANQLRGVAALSVVWSHLVGVFWGMRDFVGLATDTPVTDGPIPSIFGLANLAWFQFGPFGVGLFFLISGFVIPFSIERASTGGFVVARLLRIYPTYLVAIMLEIALLHAASHHWSKPFPYSDGTLLANFFLIYNFIGHPSIDLVNWTLCIELKFYFAIALMARAVRSGKLSAPFAMAFGILALNVGIARGFFGDLPGSFPNLFALIGSESPMVAFMLIGLAFNFHLRGFLRWPGFIGASTALFAITYASWRYGPLHASLPLAATINYGYALACFGLLYAMRAYARRVRILDFVAAISYPLYLIHCLCGIVIIKFLMIDGGLPYVQALAITLGFLVAVAFALHRTVERWSIVLGRRWSRDYRRQADIALAT